MKIHTFLDPGTVVKEGSCNVPPRLHVPINVKAEADSMSADAAGS